MALRRALVLYKSAPFISGRGGDWLRQSVVGDELFQ